LAPRWIATALTRREGRLNETRIADAGCPSHYSIRHST
jgi:hypothetical protein